ncbi:hypothetical protein EJB05_04242, partial [Eragrostis curvula]
MAKRRLPLSSRQCSTAPSVFHPWVAAQPPPTWRGGFHGLLSRRSGAPLRALAFGPGRSRQKRRDPDDGFAAHHAQMSNKIREPSSWADQDQGDLIVSLWKVEIAFSARLFSAHGVGVFCTLMVLLSCPDDRASLLSCDVDATGTGILFPRKVEPQLMVKDQRHAAI